MYSFISTLQKIGELPQTVLGWIICRCLEVSGREQYNDRDIVWFDQDAGWLSRRLSGGSFGRYIIVPAGSSEKTIKHEYGHCLQSKKWGWLYLPVIGIYSAVFCNLWDRWFHKNWNTYDRHYWYYKTRWTEADADKKGGVDRDTILSRIPRPAHVRYPAMENQVVA